MSKPIAIDPVGCGCTECMTGVYVPLDQATHKQVRAMLKGKLRNHTGEAFIKKTSLIAEHSGMTWTWGGRLG